MLSSAKIVQLPRPALVRLLLAAALLMGLAVAFTVFTGNAAAGGDTKITVNSTANIDDGECEGVPNDDEIGNCTLHEAIDMVNNGDADIINFHKPVFSKEQPGVINLCEDDGEGDLPEITRDIVIDSSNSGVILDGGDKDDDCSNKADLGLWAEGFGNGFDFELIGGKNFTIRNINGNGIDLCGNGRTPDGVCDDASLGTITITGVIIENTDGEGINVSGTNLESLSITNSDIESSGNDGIEVKIRPCVRSAGECKLSDSVIDISGNRIQSTDEGNDSGVQIDYKGVINSDTKVTISVSQNEVINGTKAGVEVKFEGCGSGGINVHVDENEDINGGDNDGVKVDIFADRCDKEEACAGCGDLDVEPGDTSDNFDVVVTVNGNGDIETHDQNNRRGVDIEVLICCEGSDSSATVEVNDNGRITGENDGVEIDTRVCCGDDNISDVSVNNNDEITGEGDKGIDVESFAGSVDVESAAGAVAGGTGFDADDNTCTITVDGNNEIDGVGDEGVQLVCFAGTIGRQGSIFSLEGEKELVAGGPVSSGDGNVSSVYLTNNNDIDGDHDAAQIEVSAGSIDGEADDNLATVTVSGNGELTGDNDDGVDVKIAAGSSVEEGDDNVTEVTIEDNQEIGGNGGEGIDVNSFAGGKTGGSEDNSTSVTIIQNGDIEGSGGEGIELDSTVCCDPENTNSITISNNKGEITGHDSDGINIETCCSRNTITIMDNEGNIRGGDDNGLELDVCSSTYDEFLSPAGGVGPVGFDDCLKDNVTFLRIINNSFSDSERDGIDIDGGTFEDEDLEIKSVISNNIIEGNGDDGIDINSANGLNIGPANEIFENGTAKDDAGIEISWGLAACEWEDGEGNKFPANHNTITQNMIYDNFGLGIDLVGFDADNSNNNDGDQCEDADPGVVGCTIFPFTPIAPNDCIPFPELQTQAGDTLIGISCTECTVEVFWADNDPDNNDDHGEGAEYIVSGEADEDGSFSIDLPCDLGPGDLTATATDKLKNTSEFAENLLTLGTSSCATDTPLPTDTVVPTSTPAETDTPVPTNTLVPTNTPEPEKVCGDVNMDGVANSVDASLVLQLKAGLISSLPNESSGDVNGDGALTSVDAALLLQFTAGLIGEDALTC